MNVKWVTDRLPSKKEVPDWDRCWVTVQEDKLYTWEIKGADLRELGSLKGGVRIVAWAKVELPKPYDPKKKPKHNGN